jgi:hypothetical protein
MKKLFILAIILGSLTAKSQLKGLIKKDSLSKKVKTLKTVSTSKLTNEEVIKGLKEALSIGTNNSTAIAGKLDGFYKNPRLFIPWPEEAKDMKAKLMMIGFTKKIEEFEMSLNRAAEEAALKAAPVFVKAISEMSVQDGFAILKGADTSATNYLRKTTYEPLMASFLPIVKEAIEKVKVTSYWNPLVSNYNKLPMVTKQNPNLDNYVANKAINGLMILLADEEIKIRKDPAARVTDLLKKVFGTKS